MDQPADGEDSKEPSSPPINVRGTRKLKTGLSSTVEFTRGQLLGKGAFAKCYELRHGEKEYAAKIIDKAALTKPHAKDKLIAEIKIHRTLKHANIVEFSTFFEDSRWYYLVMELCNHKTLRSLVRRRKKLTEIEARYYLSQIVDGVEYMHSQLVIHRDLKLDNIFLKDMVVKIGDLGLSTQLTSASEVKRSVCGTPNYIAPEVINKQGHSFPVDIWAIGIIMYTLIVGKPPFETPEKNVEDTYQRIRQLDYTFPDDVEVSPDAKDLIQRILVHDPGARPSLTEIRAHNWFKGYAPVTLPHHALLHTPRWKDRHLNYRKDNEENLASALNLNLVSAGQNANVPKSNYSDASNHNLRSPSTPKRGQKRKSTENMRSPPHHDEGSQHKRRRVLSGTKTPFTSPSHQPNLDSVAKVDDGYDGMHIDENLAEVNFGIELSRFDILHQHLARILAPIQKDNFIGQPWLEDDDSMEPGPSHWIAKWIDYSEKYGLGYLLCNGCVGVIFNDGSKIVATPKFEVIKLMYARDDEDGASPSDEGRVLMIYGNDAETRYQGDAFITKRVTLLKYFHTSLSNCFHSQGLEDERVFDGELVFAKEWRRSDSAIMFTLSNGIAQVNFYNHAKLVVSAASVDAPNDTPWRKALTLKVTYVTVAGIRSSHVLSLNTAPAQQNVTMSLTRTRFMSQHIAAPAMTGQHNSIAAANPDLYEKLSYVRDYMQEYFLQGPDGDEI